MIKIKRFEGSLGLIKFFSGLILFSFLFWSEKSNAQEEVSFSVVMPEEYIENAKFAIDFVKKQIK